VKGKGAQARRRKTARTDDLDATDRKILSVLGTEPLPKSVGALAKGIAKSRETTTKRLSKLRDLGLIAGACCARLPAPRDFEFSACILVKVDKATSKFTDVENLLIQSGVVRSTYLVTGRAADLLAFISVNPRNERLASLLRSLKDFGADTETLVVTDGLAATASDRGQVQRR
jgi:DNA-binding Lrp family transcriptional regulator